MLRESFPPPRREWAVWYYTPGSGIRPSEERFIRCLNEGHARNTSLSLLRGAFRAASTTVVRIEVPRWWIVYDRAALRRAVDGMADAPGPRPGLPATGGQRGFPSYQAASAALARWRSRNPTLTTFVEQSVDIRIVHNLGEDNA